MHLPAFDQAWFLQSLGWAIANSLWQTCILWILYKLLTNADKRLPALIRYHLSNILLLTSFAWFIITLVKNYQELSNTSAFSIQQFPFGFDRFPELVNVALPTLSVIYLILLLLFSFKFFRSLSSAYILQTRGLSKAPIELRLFAQKTAFHLGIKKPVPVWISGSISVPSVAGIFKPVILLPAAIVTSLSIQQIEAILLHELAHIRRNDYLINLLQSIIELVLFFNPFAILLSKESKSERENCCDDCVVNFEYNRHEYANALLILEESRQLYKMQSVLLSATNGKKKLLRRIKRLFLTQPQANISTRDKFNLSCLSFILLILISTIIPSKLPNKTIHPQPLVYKKRVISTSVSEITAANLKEKPAKKTILNTPPVAGTKSLHTVVKKEKRKISTSKQELSEEYVNAFINEELVNPHITPLPVTIVDHDKNGSKVIVKVQEEQSGTNQTNTYYFELNKNNATISLKPLIILNRVNIKNKTPINKKIEDSLNLINKSGVKKRITS